MLFASRLSNKTREHLTLLLKTQYWPAHNILALQRTRLHAILHHCQSTVPFYQKRFSSSGLTPEECLKPEKFKRFPILTKRDIQENTKSLISSAVQQEDLLPDATGGSTGIPLNFFHDKNYWEWERAAAIRAWKYFPGFTEKEIEAIFWGAERDIGKGLSLLRVLKSIIRQRILPLNTFDLDPNLIDNFFRYFRLIRPKIIRGYASSLFFVAKYIDNHKIPFLRPQAIISSAETLWPTMRQVVERVFGAPVYDSYGCREVSQIATECPAHQGLHIVMENQYVEIIHGQIIVTNLTNYGMPFIRYQIGDCADYLTDAPCSCGRSSLRLMGLRGRESETIVLPNGKMVHGEYFTHLFYGVLGISSFTVLYRSRSRILEIICNDLTPRLEKLFKERIATDFGFATIRFQKVSHGEKTISGKHRFIKVTHD